MKIIDKNALKKGDIFLFYERADKFKLLVIATAVSDGIYNEWKSIVADIRPYIGIITECSDYCCNWDREILYFTIERLKKYEGSLYLLNKDEINDIIMEIV